MNNYIRATSLDGNNAHPQPVTSGPACDVFTHRIGTWHAAQRWLFQWQRGVSHLSPSISLCDSFVATEAFGCWRDGGGSQAHRRWPTRLPHCRDPSLSLWTLKCIMHSAPPKAILCRPVTPDIADGVLQMQTMGQRVQRGGIFLLSW